MTGYLITDDGSGNPVNVGDGKLSMYLFATLNGRLADIQQLGHIQ